MKNEGFDLVIKNGTVLGFEPDRLRPHYDIGICGDKICRLSQTPLAGKRILDAAGKVVLPGFIDFHSHVDGKLFSAQCLIRQGATTTIGGGRNFDGIAIRNMIENGFLLNHGFYVSHSFTLRKAAGINDPYRKATKYEIENMVMLAEEFLEIGSFGIHFALELVPGTSEEELLAMARVVKKYGRVMLIHMRKDGTEAIHTLEEIFRVVEQTEVSVHVLHLMYMVGLKGVMEKALDRIEEAIARGCDITADTGIYDAFPACIGASIFDEGWQGKYGKAVSTGNLLISSGIYAGQFCDQALFDYLREEFPNTLVTAFFLDRQEIVTALKKDYVFVSTNAADGPHYACIGHPETAGTFPRLIRKYVLEEKVLPLIEAIKKITCFPARRFGLKGKGEIREGYDADLVIVDLENICDGADYVNKGDPNLPPKGIDAVVVGGKIAVDHGQIRSDCCGGTMIYYEK